MTKSIWEDVHRLFANTMPLYKRDLSICGFWYPWGKVCVCVCTLESVLLSYLGSTVFTRKQNKKTHAHVNKINP